MHDQYVTCQRKGTGTQSPPSASRSPTKPKHPFQPPKLRAPSIRPEIRRSPSPFHDAVSNRRHPAQSHSPVESNEVGTCSCQALSPVRGTAQLTFRTYSRHQPQRALTVHWPSSPLSSNASTPFNPCPEASAGLHHGRRERTNCFVVVMNTFSRLDIWISREA